MDIITLRGRPSGAVNTSPVLRSTAVILLLWCAAGAVHAASIYQCVDGHGHTTFRDTPCAMHARQTRLDVTGQSLIDPGAPRHPPPARTSKRSARPHARRASAVRRKHKQPMSWECRAANGEVFYRHARCPGSIPGDGVVRWQDGAEPQHGSSRHRRNAWSAVPVHGVKVSRSEACRRIHSAGATVRDGHRRDATVSTYDHLMGRDPCGG